MRNVQAPMFGVVTLLALIPAVCSAADPPAVQPSKPVPSTIEQLKSPDFAVRAAAGKFWWKEGLDGIETLTRLAKDRDQELADWAKDLLILVRATDKTDASPAALDLGRRYLVVPFGDRKTVLDRFPEDDKGALPVLLALLRTEADAELRQTLLDHIQSLADFPLMIALYRVEAAPEPRRRIVDDMDRLFGEARSRMIALCLDEPEARIRGAILSRLAGWESRGDIANLVELYLRQSMEAISVSGYPQAVVQLILKGRLDKAQAFLEPAALSDYSNDRTVKDWAAFLLMTGKLDEKIAELRRPREVPPGGGGRSRAAALLRQIMARLDAARAIDHKLPHPRSENAALWKNRIGELQRVLAQRENGENSDDSPSESVAHAELAVLYGALGDEEARAKEIAIVRRLAEEVKRPDGPFHPRGARYKAILIVCELDSAIAHEIRQGLPREVEEFLQSCGRYREAEGALRKIADEKTGARLEDMIFLAYRMLESGDRARAERVAGRAEEVPWPPGRYIPEEFRDRVELFKKLGWDEKAAQDERSIYAILTAERKDIFDFGFREDRRNLSEEALQFHRAGFEERAMATLDQALERAKSEPYNLIRIASAEFKMGLMDRAYAHLDRWAAIKGIGDSESLYDALHWFYPFVDWNMRRELWRDIRLAHSGEPASAWLKVCCDLLDTKGKERLAVVQREAALAGRMTDPYDQSRWLETLADLCAGDSREAARDLRIKSLAIAPSQDLCMMQAQSCVGRSDWLAAAGWYEKAWRFVVEARDSRNEPPADAGKDAEALYKCGWCLKKAGQEADGRKRMESADLMMLADSESRSSLADWLDKVGDKDAAERQRDFILTICPPDDYGTRVSEGKRMSEYLESRNWAAAERVAMSDLAFDFDYMHDNAYLIYAPMIELVRAHEMLVGGDLPGAMAIVRRHQKTNPNNHLLTAIFVAELGRLGHKTEADEVFRKHYAVLDEACRRFPQDAEWHNSLAWYCAVWARELDAALAHARRALELLPNNPGMFDTLGEVYFQRGEFKEAREAFRKCLEINPWAERAPGRLRDLDKTDEELKKMIGPWSLSQAWRNQ